jgi:hypothetical protein
MRKKILLIAAIFLISCHFFPLWAVEGQINMDGVDFNIRFIDRRVYYIDSDPIQVQITITNNSSSTYRFKLADERAFSIDFDIRTITNRPLGEADILIRKRTLNQQIYFREIAIETGESFSFVEDLQNYVNLKQPGSFRVQARIYPELYRTSYSQAIETNFLNLNLRPALIPGPDGIPLEMDIATGAVLVVQRIPPDEVVSYMLKARQESQWEKFFLYLDLEALLSRDPFQKRKWTAENEDNRRNMVKEFRLKLQNSVDDNDISVIPTTFEIERTVYDNFEGKVTVFAKFRGPAYTERRRYVYDLERRDNIWYIVSYSVEGLGTEPNARSE